MTPEETGRWHARSDAAIAEQAREDRRQRLLTRVRVGTVVGIRLVAIGLVFGSVYQFDPRWAFFALGVWLMLPPRWWRTE
jgi:hypothetical protein